MHRQHLYRPRDKLIRPAILFRGKGRISAVERVAYNPGVDVFFQAGAWVVTATCIAWAKQSFLCSIKVDEEAVPSERSILFVDDLHAQTTESSSGPSLKTAIGWCGFSHRAAPMRCSQPMRVVGVSLRWSSGGNWNCSSINMSTSTNGQLHLRVRATSPYRSVGGKCRRVRGRSAWLPPSPV